jgi:hypothetical protein
MTQHDLYDFEQKSKLMASRRLRVVVMAIMQFDDYSISIERSNLEFTML